LYLAFELGWSEWKLAFATGPAASPRLRAIGGRNVQALTQEIALAKKRFHLPDDAPVQSCYEAGRDGFGCTATLVSYGIVNVVVDSSSIEVKRRGRRRKTDSLDAGKLLSMLICGSGANATSGASCKSPASLTKIGGNCIATCWS
jgi:transposase